MIKSKIIAQKLPEGILKSDLDFPDWKKDGLAHDQGDSGQLTFYEVDGRESHFWCMATLLIAKSRKFADRFYAIRLDGQIVRVGRGPHVKQELTVYIKKSRVKALQKYLDLHKKGLTEANQIRDRIGSRRAQGQLHRAAGRSSWLWGDGK